MRWTTSARPARCSSTAYSTSPRTTRCTRSRRSDRPSFTFRAGDKRAKRERDVVPLHLRLPALGVLGARPQRHRLLVVEDAAVLRVAVQRAAGAVRDVAEVAQQR